MDIKLKGKLVSSYGVGHSPLEAEWKEAEILVSPLELLEQIPHAQINELLGLINLPNTFPEKEPIYYDCTLAKFAEQLDVPLWKAMEFGKYFRNKVEPNESEVLDIICKTLYPNYELEPSIRQQFTPLAHALYTAQKEKLK